MDGNRILDSIAPFVALARDPYMKFYEDCNQPQAYVEILNQTWFYVRETVPTISAVAMSLAPGEIRNNLLIRASEEKGHDQMLLEDLAAVGLSPKLGFSPHLEIFVSLEKNLKSSAHPASELYGHISFLECWPASFKWAGKMAQHFGVPEAATRTFRLHAIEDCSHRKSAIKEFQHPDLHAPTIVRSAATVAKIFARHWTWMNNSYSYSSIIE
tara:strand:+ start:176 stop:814 length:639 start_codon:yes stop_codon:yes gene_type:complete